MLREHAEHWRHRDRSGEVIPFSDQAEPWIAFRTYRAINWLRHAERHADHDVDAGSSSCGLRSTVPTGRSDRANDRRCVLSSTRCWPRPDLSLESCWRRELRLQQPVDLTDIRLGEPRYYLEGEGA